MSEPTEKEKRIGGAQISVHGLQSKAQILSAQCLHYSCDRETKPMKTVEWHSRGPKCAPLDRTEKTSRITDCIGGYQPRIRIEPPDVNLLTRSCFFGGYQLIDLIDYQRLALQVVMQCRMVTTLPSPFTTLSIASKQQMQIFELGGSDLSFLRHPFNIIVLIPFYRPYHIYGGVYIIHFKSKLVGEKSI